MIEKLESQVRELGYQLAVKEIYGENSKSYFDLRHKHYKLLNKLYFLQKKG